MTDDELAVAVEDAPWVRVVHKPAAKLRSKAPEQYFDREAEEARASRVPATGLKSPIFDELQKRLLALPDSAIGWFRDHFAARFMILGDWRYWQNGEQTLVKRIPSQFRWRTADGQPPRRVYRMRNTGFEEDVVFNEDPGYPWPLSSAKLADEQVDAIMELLPWQNNLNPRNPHQYIFPDWRSNRRGYVVPPRVDVAAGWQAIADRIAEHGEIGFYWNIAYRFWVHGEHYYWRMGFQPANRIVNRARLVDAKDTLWLKETPTGYELAKLNLTNETG